MPKYELPDEIVTMALLMDALQMNRNGADTPEKFSENVETAKDLSYRIGDLVASIILREARKKQ